MEELQELPQGSTGPFEVVSHIGGLGKKTWHLRQLQSGHEYTVNPATTLDWPKAKKSPPGPCIILSIDGSFMVGMHLGSGAVFADRSPPTGIKI